ncbi:MAG: hypothetical protein J0H69_19355 [Burkholderiales bacterium]|jgi:hypothetical protein|nr:hypothetical protein [Burkholderiales bacterium]
MTEIPTPLFWLLVLMAGVGFLTVMLRFLRRSRPPEDDPRTEVPSQLSPSHRAPAGYKWVLLPDDD